MVIGNQAHEVYVKGWGDHAASSPGGFYILMLIDSLPGGYLVTVPTDAFTLRYG